MAAAGITAAGTAGIITAKGKDFTQHK